MASQLTFKTGHFVLLAGVVICLGLVVPAQSNKEENQKVDQPSIQITRIPSAGGGPDRLETMAGTVSGVNHKECKVVLFALGGDTWYVQPYVNSPYTDINADGRWESDTHLGSRYAALVVRPSYHPPANTGTLPAVGGDILAMLSVTAMAKPQSAPVQTSDGAGKKVTEPKISITKVPPAGGGPDRLEPIAGTVSGVNVKELKVVIFAMGGDTWYVQPYGNSPYTEIKADGRWENDTHLGSRYAALLVKPSYQAPATTHSLPPVAGEILAIVSVAARVRERREHTRTIRFSGYEWNVKSSAGRVGPGPNYFAGANVAVDKRGRLHLRIDNPEGHWVCSEVISQQSFGYGTYRFYVDSNIDHVDTNAVLGLFTWSDAPAYHNREIDIEVSRWGKTDNENGQFVVQPYTQNMIRFEIPSGLAASTHSFTWQPNRVFLQSIRGRQPDRRVASDVIRQHTFTENIPQAGGENARINLWLMGGRPPANGRAVHVIISRFEFIPAP